jgi:hypothetical protein
MYLEEGSLKQNSGAAGKRLASEASLSQKIPDRRIVGVNVYYAFV